ncbi:ABC transporter permease [Stenotrophomonas acidaminiphila]
MTEQNASPSRTAPAPASTGFWRELRHSLSNPEFWGLSSWLDILVRARRSRFGIFWLMAPAVVYVFGLGSFFAAMQQRDLALFAAHVALGAMVFRILMSTLTGSANVFASSHAFIMDGHMRLTDYLLQSLARSFFDFCMYVPVALVALAMYARVADLQPAGLLLAPLTLLVIYVNSLWVSVVFSLLGARFSDFGQLLNNISIFMFLLTPIIWYPEMMPADSIRGMLMRLSPFYHFVQLFRAPILGEAVEPLTWWYVGTMTVVGLVVATFTYRRYARYVPLWI